MNLEIGNIYVDKSSPEIRMHVIDVQRDLVICNLEGGGFKYRIPTEKFEEYFREPLTEDGD